MSPPVIRTNHAGPRRGASDPGFVLPPGACDTHVHILGPYDRHPLLVTRMIEPPAAPVEDYLATARPLGLARAVIVQPSVYASDNRCTLQGPRGVPAVRIASPVVVLNANRVRGGELNSVQVTSAKSVAALGNVTSGPVTVNGNPLPAPFAALNLLG